MVTSKVGFGAPAESTLVVRYDFDNMVLAVDLASDALTIADKARPDPGGPSHSSWAVMLETTLSSTREPLVLVPRWIRIKC